MAEPPDYVTLDEAEGIVAKTLDIGPGEARQLTRRWVEGDRLLVRCIEEARRDDMGPWRPKAERAWRFTEMPPFGPSLTYETLRKPQLYPRRHPDGTANWGSIGVSHRILFLFDPASLRELAEEHREQSRKVEDREPRGQADEAGTASNDARGVGSSHGVAEQPAERKAREDREWAAKAMHKIASERACAGEQPFSRARMNRVVRDQAEKEQRSISDRALLDAWLGLPDEFKVNGAPKTPGN